MSQNYFQDADTVPKKAASCHFQQWPGACSQSSWSFIILVWRCWTRSNLSGGQTSGYCPVDLHTSRISSFAITEILRHTIRQCVIKVKYASFHYTVTGVTRAGVTC
jgi:hypothetical protein